LLLILYWLVRRRAVIVVSGEGLRKAVTLREEVKSIQIRRTLTTKEEENKERREFEINE